MKTLFEEINNQYHPFGYATELTNGNIVGAYGNGNFTEYSKGKKLHHSYRYIKTYTGVEKVKSPHRDEKFIQLCMMGGKLVHNKSFCFTKYGILSFITGQIAELPLGATVYEAKVSDEETLLIIKEKRYLFDGIIFIEK